MPVMALIGIPLDIKVSSRIHRTIMKQNNLIVGLTASSLGFAQTVFYLQELVFSSLMPVIVPNFAKLVDLSRRSFLIYFVPETLKFSIFKKEGISI